MQKKVSFNTLGCKLNFSETSSIAREFTEKGFKIKLVDFESAEEIKKRYTKKKNKPLAFQEVGKKLENLYPLNSYN